MKLLVATKTGQGVRKNDFCFVPEGEVVHFGFECDGGSVDDHCGCKRAMCGIECAKATTTMKVVEVKMDRWQLIDRLRSHYEEDWKMKAHRAQKMAMEEATELISLADQFEDGAIIEKRGKNLQVRESGRA